MSVVYTCFCTDIIHEGHRNLLHEAQKYGEVVVGALTDAAMIQFDRFPTISFAERRKLLEELPEVSRVIVQDEIFYDKVFDALNPG